MTPDGPTVGVPDRSTTPARDRIVADVEDAGATARVGDPGALADAELAALVAPGEDALRAIAAADPTVPVLPVEVAAGVRSVATEDVGSALECVLEGSATTERHPVLRVAVDGTELGPVLREATLLTAEPARISEFAVESEAAGVVDEVRADGLVVATPAGSRGYAAAGEGPLLAPGTGLSVVPVAPFRIDRARWVLPVADLAVTVCRDESPVSVEIDGTDRTTASRDETVAIGLAGELRTLVVPESGPTFP